MPTNRETAERVMRELWFQSGNHVKNVGGDDVEPFMQDYDYEDPENGLVIRREGDAVTVIAEHEEYHHGKPTRVNYVVEYDSDIRRLPRVFRDVDRGEGILVPHTVPLRTYPEIAECIGIVIGQSSLKKPA